MTEKTASKNYYVAYYTSMHGFNYIPLTPLRLSTIREIFFCYRYCDEEAISVVSEEKK